MVVRDRFLPEGWFPNGMDSCRDEIEGFGGYIESVRLDLEKANGGLVPHAGWYFSGRLAALVFHSVAKGQSPDVVAVFGGHLCAGSGIIYTDDAWSTPLGPLPIDQDLSRALMEKTPLRAEGPLTNDNTIEVQLPLVKYYFPHSKLLAVRAPHSEDSIQIGRLLVELAREQGKTVAAFGSTDLTHYGPNYAYSPKGSGPEAVRWVKEINDRGFIDRALEMDPKGMLEHAADKHSACSAGGAVAAMTTCQVLGATRGVLADYYTSNDIMSGSSFVGYAGIVY